MKHVFRTVEASSDQRESRNEKLISGEVLIGDFFAPVKSDLIDSLIERYNNMRKKLENMSDLIRTSDNEIAISYFLEGNYKDKRKVYIPPIRELFDLSGALDSLNAAYWQEALNLTDVYEYMPNEKRTEWDENIREMRAPNFEDTTVRATLSELLFSREKFFSERVDGIFRALSRDHVTNRPEGFGKRMIIDRIYNEWGNCDYDRTGYLDDLRKVIAKFMGRDSPCYRNTDRVLKIARERTGEWLYIDGGAIKIKAFIKGTLHAEIHPDMAWRLNNILAFLHPSAIPTVHRSKPKAKQKNYHLVENLLPFSVLKELGEIERLRTNITQNNHWDKPREPVTKNPYNRRFSFSHDVSAYTREGAEKVMLTLGGVKKNVNSLTWFEFGYDPTMAIEEILLTGAIPDSKSHQYYPTNVDLARIVIDCADIQSSEICLEPSAGLGGLADHMPRERTTCVEISSLHCKVLEAKGFKVIEADFIKWSEETETRYDVIVMNPPFSEGRAEAHIKSAINLVKKGGRIAAILPAGYDRKNLFPGWYCEWSGVHEKMFKGTNISIQYVIAWNPL